MLGPALKDHGNIIRCERIFNCVTRQYHAYSADSVGASLLKDAWGNYVGAKLTIKICLRLVIFLIDTLWFCRPTLVQMHYNAVLMSSSTYVFAGVDILYGDRALKLPSPEALLQPKMHRVHMCLAAGLYPDPPEERAGLPGRGGYG